MWVLFRCKLKLMNQLTFKIIIGKKGRYKMLDNAFGIVFGLLLLCALIPLFRSALPVIGLVFLGLFIAIISVASSSAAIYHTQGEIRLTEECIWQDKQAFPSSYLQRIEVVFKGFRGETTAFSKRLPADGGGNTITIWLKNGIKPVIIDFLVVARGQKEQLESLLKKWRKMGIKVSADGIDLV
jgi:hypothetical protein